MPSVCFGISRVTLPAFVMKYILVIIFLSLITVSCNSHTNLPSTLKKGTSESHINDYESNWVYFDLDKPTKIRVISHQLAGVDCGNIVTASVTIGVTNSNDTIRVFELCNTQKNFSITESVMVTPAKRPSFNIIHPNMFIQTKEGELLPHPYDIQVLLTTYGTIERK
ncbi:hypothetical protein [uncultured Flavobacterium sp.]|uniref:hypothetical protein n=1 Tax=uncultured Flavobacterium sp. TaxID=165435 RepID=UPI0025EF5C5E|nr:hypothetical protein [uncultured Flavobacterium sp.]